MSDVLTECSSLLTQYNPSLCLIFQKEASAVPQLGNRLLLPRPWQEQYQIHFAKSINVIFKDLLAAID